MNTLDKSLSLIEKFYQDTPKSTIDEMFAKTRAMFVDDVYADEYLESFNSSFSFNDIDLAFAFSSSEIFTQDNAIVMNVVMPTQFNLSNQYEDSIAHQYAA